VIPASLLLSDSAMPDILLAAAHDVKPRANMEGPGLRHREISNLQFQILNLEFCYSFFAYA